MAKRRAAIVHRIVFLLIMLLGVMFFASRVGMPNTGRASAQTLLLLNAPSTVTIGDEFNVQIVVTDVSDLLSYMLEMKFDPTVLEYRGISYSNFLEGTPPVYVFYAEPFVQDTRVSSISALRSVSTGVSGSSTLATLRFFAIGKGHTNLMPSGTLLSPSGDIPALLSGAELNILPKCIDGDGDGYGDDCAAGLDCNDANAAVHPGATEVCGNGIDDDCTGGDAVCQACGNGAVEGTEVCDGNARGCVAPEGGLGTQQCNPQCTGFTSCMVTPICGNGIVEGSEICDPPSSVQSCMSNGQSGTKFCNPGCGSFGSCMLSQNNQTNQTNSTEPTTPADIGLTIPRTFLIITTNDTNITYNVTHTAALSSCSVVLDGIPAATDSQFVGRLPIHIAQHGRHQWRVQCLTRAGRAISLPEYPLYAFRVAKFGGMTTDVRTVPTLERVLNFVLEQPNYGSVQFSQSVDLTQATDLDGVVQFGQGSLSIDTTRAPGINRPASVTLQSVTYRNPRILRDGRVCAYPICTIVRYEKPTLTFTVPGFSTYTIEESPTPSTTNTQTPTTSFPAPVSTPPTTAAPVQSAQTVLPCAASLSSGTAEVEAAQNGVLCLMVLGQQYRLRVASIGDTLTLLQETPTVGTLALAHDAATFDVDQNGASDFSLTYLGKRGSNAAIRVSFATQSPQVLSETVSTEPPSQIPLQLIRTAAPVVENPTSVEHIAPQPVTFRLPYLWIGLILIIAICAIVALAAFIPHPEQKTQSFQSKEFNPHLGQELSSLGIKPEDAAKRMMERRGRN